MLLTLHWLTDPLPLLPAPSDGKSVLLLELQLSRLARLLLTEPRALKFDDIVACSYEKLFQVLLRYLKADTALI